MVDFHAIATGINPQAVAEPGASGKGVTNTPPFLIEQVALGPTLDLIPAVAQDGSIELTAMVNLTEFLGYDKATNTVPVYVNGEKQDVEPPLPRIRARPMMGRARLYDGQSLLLIGSGASVTNTSPDKVPILRDLPLVGHLFRSNEVSRSSRSFLVLILPKLIDPAGNPIYTPDNLPFDPNAVPPQPK